MSIAPIPILTLPILISDARPNERPLGTGVDATIQLEEGAYACVSDQPKAWPPSEYWEFSALTQLVGAKTVPLTLRRCARISNHCPFYREIEIGRPIGQVARILAECSLECRWNQTIKGELGNGQFEVRCANRQSTGNRLDDGGWDIHFRPPIPLESADDFLWNLATVLRLADAIEYEWTTEILFAPDGEDLRRHRINGLVQKGSNRCRVWLIDKDSLESLIGIAARWTDKPSDHAFRLTINLLNQIEAGETYLELKMAGLLFLFERMALKSATLTAPAKGWTYDPQACDLKNGGRWVSLEDKLKCLFAEAGLEGLDAVATKINDIRNDVLHGKEKNTPYITMLNVRRALCQLIFFILLKLAGYSGRYNRMFTEHKYATVKFPDDIEIDLKPTREAILAYL